MAVAIEQPRSVFGEGDDIFCTYAVEIVLRSKLMAGTPKDPKIVEGWLRAKMGLKAEEEIAQMTRRTLEELGVDLPLDATFEDIEKASEHIAGLKQTCGFKRDDEGLYIESRQVKALIKESVNINFAGEKGWGASNKKSPLGFVAERVFVEPERIHLGTSEPDGVEMVIGHVRGPAGLRSTIGYHEYVEGPTLGFSVRVLRDADEFLSKHDKWARIWTHAQLNGLGALRSQGHGQFVVTEWERV